MEKSKYGAKRKINRRRRSELSKFNGIITGDLLEDFINEEWAIADREKFRERYLTALSFLSDYFLNEKNYAICVDYCLKALQYDDCLEDIHGRLMKSYFHSHQKDRALKQYQKCLSALKKLQTTPSKEITELFEYMKSR